MDGVLVDSEPLHLQAEKLTFLPYGIELSENDIQAYVGQKVQKTLSMVINRYKLDITIEELYTAHKKNLINIFDKEVCAVKGVIEFIDELKNQKILTAVASSSHRELVCLVLDKFRLTQKFNVVVTGDDVTLSKPQPDIFIEAAKCLGKAPGHCIVIEDSENGVVAAKKAGMTCIGFKAPDNKSQNLDLADIIVEDFNHLNYKILKDMMDKHENSNY
jgi:HAD superfamily hydrolase (TIGR01509 family)